MDKREDRVNRVDRENPVDRKEAEKICALCERALPLCGGRMKGLLFCRRKGVVDGGYHCGKFSFDPLKRTPPPKPRFRGLSDYLEEEAPYLFSKHSPEGQNEAGAGQLRDRFRKE